MKIGDQVRFLSEVGGGRVAGFQGKNIVLVEDEDGFQVPMRVTEVVVVNEELSGESLEFLRPSGSKRPSAERATAHEGKADTSADTKGVQSNHNYQLSTINSKLSPLNSPLSTTFRPKPEERRGGDKLSAYLAFVPMDVKELSQTRFESYLVNDSNYYLRYVYMTAESNAWQVRSTGEVEPNTKEFIEEFGREDLNQLERCCIQLLAYKREKPFLLKPAVNAPLRIDPVKFYKLHTFAENDFFEQPALIYTIIENDVQKVKI